MAGVYNDLLQAESEYILQLRLQFDNSPQRLRFKSHEDLSVALMIRFSMR